MALATTPVTPTIALVGSGEYLEVSRQVDEHLLALVARPGGRPRVACLPTAASTEGADVWQGWATRGVAWFESLGAEAVAVPVVDRSSAADPAHADAVAVADLVYLSGGKPVHLYETLAGTAVWAAVEAVLARGGVLAGCSAGAMVQGEQIASLGGATRTGSASTTAGFGLLPGTVVLPHYDEWGARLAPAVESHTGAGLVVVGLDRGTGLVRHRGGFRAVGPGSVTVHRGDTVVGFHDEQLPGDILRPAAS